jgi:glycosyltransferase involved in cell wall biosynthesis
MTAPLVSVVMPVYNGERFVVEAVRSIVAQTFADFELLVVDDGSTDGTPELLAAEQARDPRLVVHRQPSNQGFLAALTTGCTLARGELIARMDADDISLPTRLERQVAFLQANPAVGVVGSAIQFVDDRGARGRIKSYPIGGGLAAWSMLFFNSLVHPSVMLRRAALEAAGGYPAGCAGGTEDYALFLELSWKSRIANVADVLLLYRVWGGNMTKTRWEAQERDATRLLQEFVQRTFDLTLTADNVLALRGLSRNDYPKTSRDVRTLAALIERLRAEYTKSPRLTGVDRKEIKKDAGVRLLLLSALALRTDPFFSARLALQALLTSPGSASTFAMKVVRQLRGAD